MINLPKLLKEHVPLYVCGLSLAVLGYIGYHIVRWIINKCQRTEKIDQVKRENFNNQEPSLDSKPLVNRVSHLEINLDKVTIGQGEYVVFHKLPTGEKQQLSPETFDQVYKVLLQHSPIALVNSRFEKASEEYANRYEVIKAKLKEIDPTLEAIFVPRTLYELIFIRKCIQEDLKYKEICPLLDKKIRDHIQQSRFIKMTPEERNKCLEKNGFLINKRKCWHLCYFTEFGDNEHVGVKKIAYRLNKLIFKAFDPPSEGFTHQEFAAFAEKEIEFLKTHYKKQREIASILSSEAPGPTTHFCCDSTAGIIAPMGIRNETDAQIIRNAITLDCSKIAQHSLFLYRGADFEKDSTSCWRDNDTPYSLSYGSSLFAGCLYDGAATAFHYMRKGKNAYAISVPFNQLNDSPFFVPTTHTVTQLFSDGEIFHARTKVWKDFDMKNIRGLWGSNVRIRNHIRNHLQSNLNQEELNTQFKTYKSKAFQLK